MVTFAEVMYFSLNFCRAGVKGLPHRLQHMLLVLLSL